MTQKELFLKIWNTRPHVSEVSGTPLGEIPLAQFFAHILSKGAYPRFKLCEDNIMLMTFEEHRDFDGGRATDKNGNPKDIWIPVFEKAQLLKQKYYQKRLFV